jgi:hypothetical protein
MSDVDRLYANIIDLRLSSDRTVERLEQEARALRDGGEPALARQLVGLALQGSALMPHLKQRLRDFSKAELEDPGP